MRNLLRNNLNLWSVCSFCLRIMGAFAAKFSKFDFIQRSKTAKCLAVLLVLLFLVHGLVCVAVSTWMETMGVSKCQFMASFFASVHVLLASGCFAIVMCLCTLMLRRQIRGYYRGFVFCLAFTLVFEIAAAIVATVHQDIVETSEFQREMEKCSNLGQNSVGDIWVTCWILIQEKYKCCGITDYKNWLKVYPLQNATYGSQTVTAFDVGESSLLQSCACKENGVLCHTVPIYGNIYQNTCLGVTRDKLSFIYTFIRISAPIFAVLQFLAFASVSFIFTKLYASNVVAVYVIRDDVKIQPAV